MMTPAEIRNVATIININKDAFLTINNVYVAWAGATFVRLSSFEQDDQMIAQIETQGLNVDGMYESFCDYLPQLFPRE